MSRRKVISIIACALSAATALAFGSIAYRIFDDQRVLQSATPTNAKIISVRTTKSTAFGTIDFALMTASGNIACEEEVRLGNSLSNFKPGDTISVVPRSDACSAPLVGSAPQSPVPFTLVTLAALAGVVVYGVRSLRR